MYERVKKVTRAWSPVSPAEVEHEDMAKGRSISSEEPETEIVWDEASGQAAYQLLTGGYGVGGLSCWTTSPLSALHCLCIGYAACLGAKWRCRDLGATSLCVP